jgi:mRNA interferase RelE/StbE
MASYQIEWRKSTKRDLKSIPSQQVERIVSTVTALANDPRPSGCTKLSGSDCAYRIRIGDYRVIYEIFDNKLLIEIVRAAHRKDIYR